MIDMNIKNTKSKFLNCYVSGTTLDEESLAEMMIKTNVYISDFIYRDSTFNESYIRIYNGLIDKHHNLLRECPDGAREIIKPIQLWHLYDTTFFGPSGGILSMDGTILKYFSPMDNPTIYGLVSDARALANEFSFLNMVITVTEYHCASIKLKETQLCNIYIKNGIARIDKPDMSVHNGRNFAEGVRRAKYLNHSENAAGIKLMNTICKKIDEKLSLFY